MWWDASVPPGPVSSLAQDAFTLGTHIESTCTEHTHTHTQIYMWRGTHYGQTFVSEHMNPVFQKATVPSLGMVSDSTVDFKGKRIQVSHHFK